MQCLEAYGRVDDAEAEGLRLLEKLRSTSKLGKRKGKILPEVDKGGVGDKDKDLCLLIVEIVVALVRCAAVGPCKDDGPFRRVRDLVEGVRPWLRYLSVNCCWNCFVFCFWARKFNNTFIILMVFKLQR